MTIQIDGTNTVNKGAELMLYAILEEIENVYPHAQVYYNSPAGSVTQIDSKLAINRRLWLTCWRYPRAILSKLKLKHDYPFFSVYHPVKGIDLLLDAGGFQFSDQWNHSDAFLDKLENYYHKLKQFGTKIILLPQAFGPFKTPNGRRCASILNRYVDVIIAREFKSMQYLLEAGADSEKVWKYPDFTGLVDGILPQQYQSIRGKVCIIPNKKMFTHASLPDDQYYRFVKQVVALTKAKNQVPFLLNHEGEGDLAICAAINERLDSPLPVISGLASREIKGVIGASYLVVSSRFHGVASSLTQGIPCLATSWSHKYDLLFNDFDQSEMVLDIQTDLSKALAKVDGLLNAEPNRETRAHLTQKKEEIKATNREMWSKIWTHLKK